MGEQLSLTSRVALVRYWWPRRLLPSDSRFAVANDDRRLVVGWVRVLGVTRVANRDVLDVCGSHGLLWVPFEDVLQADWLEAA